ncbi:MAG: haloacid dehalogenase [Dehalococcoidia bacterium]|nr:MAG: haloacid dehalogenase [Dehalococcoidia bacterium]
MTELEEIVEAARATLETKHRLREAALQVQREVIRASATAIRATHRGEFAAAQALLDQAGAALARMSTEMADHPDLRYGGVLQDAEKEFAEASLTLAILAEQPLPSPEALGITVAAYLNGLGEAVGELRRAVLDILRRGGLGRSEALLEMMDAIYTVLVTVDYPDGLTGGLRRTTDGVRAILERTRGDLTVAIRQQRLEETLNRALERVDWGPRSA